MHVLAQQTLQSTLVLHAGSKHVYMHRVDAAAGWVGTGGSSRNGHDAEMR